MTNLNSPLVSVVIPSFNHASFLPRALQSVLCQTYTNWEVIVVDNYSTDHTDKVIATFDDPRFSCIKIHNYGIIAASRNAGIRMAKGEWIAFLDSDDIWYSQKLEVFYYHLIKFDFHVFSTNEYQYNIITKRKYPLVYGPYCHNFYLDLLINGNKLSPSATLVNRDFITSRGLFFRENKEFITVEDFDFWLLLARSGAIFKFVSSIQGEYTIHSTNASSSFELHFANTLSVLHDHLSNLQVSDSVKDFLCRVANARLLVSRSRYYFINHYYLLFLESILSAFLKYPVATFRHILLKSTNISFPKFF